MSYHRIYLSGNTVHIVEMGECDELDYNQNKFLSGERFESPDAAVDYIRENRELLPKGVDCPYVENDSTHCLDRWR